MAQPWPSWRPRPAREAGAALLLALAAACEAPADAPPTELRAQADARAPTAWRVEWEDEGAVRTWVEYGRVADALDRRTPEATAPRATLVALTAGYTWYARGVGVGADGVERRTALAELAVAAPPAALPPWTVEWEDAAAVDPDALIFVSLVKLGASWLVGITREGEYAWWVQAEGEISIPSAHPGADGRSFVLTHHARMEGVAGSGVRRVSLDGAEDVLTPGAGHHDAVQLPDGTLAWIRNENPTGVTLEDGQVADLSVDTVVLNAEGGAEADARVLFSFLDDYGHPPYATCAHFDDEGQGSGKDYTHANSILYDADRDAILVMSKNLDALVSIDRASGARQWQVGGRWGDFRDLDGDVLADPENPADVGGPNHTWWSHAHLSHAWSDGMLVFDNGYHHADRVSRVVEYRLDPDARTLQKVWEVADEDGVFNPLLGDARRVAGGNTLVSWTVSGRLTEHTPDGAVAWRASVGLGSATGRVSYVPDPYDLNAP